jgi:glycerol uptake facilitator-like aquaporin
MVYYTNFAFALFIAICYGRQFSGGVYNPAVVLFRQFRKNDRMSIKVGFLYQFFQILGGTAGCFIGNIKIIFSSL